MNTAQDLTSPAAAAAKPASARTESPALLPPVDVFEDGDGITLMADLPGASRDSLQLDVDGDRLAIDADITVPTTEGLTPLYAEVRRRRYQRTFTLSKELDASRISAELNHGVLRVHIPKMPHAQPKRVQVRVG